MSNNEALQSALFTYIMHVYSVLESTIDLYVHVEMTGQLPGEAADSEPTTATGNDRPGSIENIRVPSPPQYPPPHGQNSPAFFPLDSVQGQFEPEELHVALEESASEAEGRTGAHDGDNDSESDSESDSDEEDSWGQWYVRRDYEMERLEESTRQRLALANAKDSDLEYEVNSSSTEESNTINGDENESMTFELSGDETDGDISDDESEFEWIHDRGEMIAPY